MILRSLTFFLAILAGTAALGALITFFLVQAISRPINGLIRATQIVAEGHYARTITWIPRVYELAVLSEAFNSMADELAIRENTLQEKSDSLTLLNKSYLDLIGFVSHELKGILASTILNAYTVRDGFLGMVNFKQRKALDSITRNLDYLAETVKNFLNLSRIEKGELEPRRETVNLKRDVFEEAVDNFSKAIEEMRVTLRMEVPEDIEVAVDRDLFLIVANNLIGNALKYGVTGGRIEVSARDLNGVIEVSVYNDGEPLSPDDTEKLFLKFVRLDDAKKRRIKGTGLGLFITKNIIESHGGHVRCEPCAKGNRFIFTFQRGENAKTA